MHEFAILQGKHHSKKCKNQIFRRVYLWWLISLANSINVLSLKGNELPIGGTSFPVILFMVVNYQLGDINSQILIFSKFPKNVTNSVVLQIIRVLFF